MLRIAHLSVGNALKLFYDKDLFTGIVFTFLSAR